MSDQPRRPPPSAWEIQVSQQIAGFLTEENFRYHHISEDCIELFLQGRNLTMRMIVYPHHRHLVIRIPAFIRNMELRRLDVLNAIMKMMNDFFDIRFELSEDGRSLSGAINHVIDDNVLTKGQFMHCMNLLAYLIDDCYPRLMRIAMGKEPEEAETLAGPDGEPPDSGEELEPEDEGTTSEAETPDEEEDAEKDKEKEKAQPKGGVTLN